MPQEPMLPSKSLSGVVVEVLQCHKVEQQPLGVLWIEGAVDLCVTCVQHYLFSNDVRWTSSPLWKLLQPAVCHACNPFSHVTACHAFWSGESMTHILAYPK